jgi:sugar/nucleoside kinase (ribokinase family)
VRPRRLVMVGSVVVDVLLYVDGLPERGGDVLASGMLTSAGGGFNLLVAARRLGMDAAYGGRTGTGPFGDQARRALDDAGIPTLLPPGHEGDTGVVVGLVEPDGERTFATSPGVEARLTPEDLAVLALRPADGVYVSGYDLVYPVSGRSLEEWLPQLPDELLLAIDPGPLAADVPAARMDAVLRRTDLLSLNAVEAAALSGRQGPAEAAAILRERLRSGAMVVVRTGAAGCWLAAGDADPDQIAGRPARVVVDTTGAGDTHVAAFLAGLSHGDSPSRAARVANVAASLSVERAGPATAPTLDELTPTLGKG